MTSVRKAVKNCKKRMRQRNAIAPDNGHALKAILELFQKGASNYLEYTNVGVIRSFAKIKSTNARLERKKRKQGKWKEWCEFKTQIMRRQVTMLPPYMLGSDYPPHDFSYEKMTNLIQTNRNEQG